MLDRDGDEREQEGETGLVTPTYNWWQLYTALQKYMLFRKGVLHFFLGSYELGEN